ncbi:MAG: PQQ-binding-like beta-propeller repeat protein, partial [Planctomycetes bacterium]|nr:PQQ-binding-like beta-propeller repeat protein [Planctomycetota bacterium]
MHGRTFRNIWWIVLLCSVSLSTPVWGQPDAPPEKADPAETPKLSPAEITALVQRLGDDAHTERHEAADRLTALGVDAQDALMAGLDHEDPEVRRRCRWILGDVLQADFERRLAAFLADKENRQDHNLPGWERFSGMIGHDGPARELFAAMQKAESGLLTSATAGQSAAAESVRLRFRQVFQMLSVRDASLRRAPSLGTVAALVFVLADKELDLPADLVDSPYLSTVVQQPAFQKALAEGPAKDAVRKLLGQWILRPSGINLLTTKLRMSTQFKIADGLQLACRVVRNRKEVSPYLRVYAISTLGSLGGKQYAAMMTELLEDESECHRRTVNGKQLSIEIRDVALGWLIHITGQDHAEYGQNQAKTVFDRLKTSPTYHISASYMVFDDPKKRDEALAKWKAWVAKNPLPELPPEAKPEDPPVPAIAVRTNPVRAMNPLGGIAKLGNEDPMDWLGGLGLEMADRIQVRYLTTARELYRQKRYLEAIRLLGNILAARSDRLFQPDLKVQLFRCLKPEAEQLIETLPSEGRKAYRLLFEAEASRQLAEAVETGDLEQLARVAECFFHTPPGADATYLLAMHQIDRDDPFRAAMYLQRLRTRSRDADRFEPMLTLQLAACWARAEAREPADRVLRELKARQGGKPVLVAGEPRELFAGADEAMDWLEAIVGPLPPGRVGDGWPMFRGAPSRNLPANSGSPYLETDVLVPDCEDPTVGKTVTELRKQIHDDHRAVLPSAHPLVVGQTIVLRTATHVRAVDFTSGRVLWEAPTEDTLRHFLGHEDEETKKGQAEALARGLRRRLWNDATFGTLSSDGRLVFAVEDLAFGFGADYQRMRVTSDGQRQLDPDWIKQSNLLAAYDLATGKVRWEIGSLSEPAEEDRPSTFFLGPPLPLGRRLYVVAESAGSVRLMELDGETGRRIWELALDRREPGLPLSMSTRMPLAMLQSSAHRSGACPSYADGVLVCRTSARRFVAVELTTRAVRWIFETPDPELPPGMNRGFGNVLQRKLYEATTNADQNRWADSSVTIAQQRVLLAPAGSDRLLCLNLTDGRLLWSIPRGDGLYVGGVHADSAIVVGRGSLWAVNMADGSPAWTDGAIALPAGALPSGRGFLSDEHYHVPLSTAEVVSVDLTTGTLTSRSRSPSGIVPGNLVACRDVVLSQHVDGLRRFESLPERRQRSVAALDRLPDDPEALTDCGEVLLYEGQISEAIDYLRRAMDIRPTDRTRRVLTDALIEGLRVDFATFRDRADEMEPLIDDPASRARFLHALARALHQAGLASDAMETYLKLIDLDQQPPELEHVEAARTVRRDRLIAACVAQLRDEATPADLALIDALIAARRIDGRLPAFLSYFPTHPHAEEARSRLAAELRKKKEWFAAEQMLTTLRGSDDPARRREAVARLAQLWREAGKPERTVALHGELAGALADEICLDGKTGRQLAEALAADERIGKLVNVPDPWPIEPVDAMATNTRSSVIMRYPISLTDAAGRFPTELYATIDSQGQHIVGSDRLGRQTW